MHLSPKSIIDNHWQNGAGPGGNINISRIATAGAALRPERDYAVEKPRPISVAVGDYGASRIAPARFAS